jgi:DNA-binding LacI/PurR family transcriptional regulator
MKRWVGSLISVLAAVGLGTLAQAQTVAIKPAVVFSTGGKFDKSFNEGVSQGAERFRKETNIAVAEFEPSNETQFEQALRRFAQRGQDPIIAVGFAQAVALAKVAREFPNIHFTVIDSVVNLPNVQSVVFKEQEGSFLVGVLAAMASKTGKIGFVGGMDIPLVRRFQCGFEQGANGERGLSGGGDHVFHRHERHSLLWVVASLPPLLAPLVATDDLLPSLLLFRAVLCSLRPWRSHRRCSNHTPARTGKAAPLPHARPAAQR